MTLYIGLDFVIRFNIATSERTATMWDALLIIVPYIYVLPGCQFDEKRNDLSSRPARHVFALRVRARIPLTRRDDRFRRATRFLGVYQLVLQQQKTKQKVACYQSLLCSSWRAQMIFQLKPFFATCNSHGVSNSIIALRSSDAQINLYILNENYKWFLCCKKLME